MAKGKASTIELAPEERLELESLTRRRSTGQALALRARIVLTAAEGRSNAQIARELAINVDTVRLWRDRWVGLQGIDLETMSLTERLQDAPRPGVTPKFSTEQRWETSSAGV